MAEQLWKGRFSKAVDSRVNDFNSSIRRRGKRSCGGAAGNHAGFRTAV